MGNNNSTFDPSTLPKCDRQLAATHTHSAQSLDTAAIVRLTQAISGELVRSTIVERLLRVVLENTGVERVLLLRPDKGEWQLEAHGVVQDDVISVVLTSAEKTQALWSHKIVEAVIHSHNYLLIKDVQQDNSISGNAYICEQKIRSVLCVPVLQQQELAAVLYLENKLPHNLITTQCVSLVLTLATQAAIALKNASLHNDVVRQVNRLRHAETALRAIASETASTTGEDFFNSLVLNLATSLNVQRVLVSECIDAGDQRVRTLAHIKHGKPADNVEYNLAGTPCEGVIQGNFSFFPENLEKLYAREKGYESFMGVPALDLSGRVLGHLAIFSTHDMHQLPHAEAILRIFATRVGVELHRKRTQKKLQDSEEKYRLLVENQTDLIVKMDALGDFQFISPSYCELFARSESDLQGSAFREQINTGDMEQVNKAWQELLCEPHSVQFEHRALTARGERWLSWSLSALKNAAGTIVEIVGLGRDISSRRKAEEQARQNLHTLAHVARVHSMGEMASTLAHELNQPLTAVLSFAQASQRVLNKNNFDKKEVNFALERIAVNAKRAGDIISHMRGFIRKEEPHTEYTNINQLINTAMELIHSELQYLGIDVELNFQESMPDVSVDPVQIQQVILNLVRNSMEAIDAYGDCERRIIIETGMKRPGGVEVTITDTGPGLDAEIRERIFTSFVTTKEEGMGIGLSICKSIVEAHGGELVTGQSSGGAVFSFVLATGDGYANTKQ